MANDEKTEKPNKFGERRRRVMEARENKGLGEMARGLRKMPGETAKATLEVSASLAGVSLRVSREFLQIAPEAGKFLSADDIRAWGEIGRKLTMASVELGAKYFADGVSELKAVPKAARPLVFQICQRQLILSSSVALETYRLAPELSRQIGDAELTRAIFSVAAEIAQRSAKHSADFLKATPKVVETLATFGDDRNRVAKYALNLASTFAARTGGMTADFWTLLPAALQDLASENAIELLKTSADFLELGGSVTLHFVAASGDCLRKIPAVFDFWREMLWTISKHGNAVLISFVRASPSFFAQLSTGKHSDLDSLARRVILLTHEVARVDAEAALACFRSSTQALRKVSIGQFEDWIAEGLKPEKFANNRARRSYFALETRRSNDRLNEGAEGLPLEKVQGILRLYVEGLTDRQVEISQISALPNESRINDGRTIFLPAQVSEFGDDDLDFRLYKVLAAHGAGQIEFGTNDKDTNGLKAAFASLSELYEATAAETDAFSLAGYIEDVQKGETALSIAEQAKSDKERIKKLPKNSDYKAVLAVFPEISLARKIFTTLENGRIDRRLRFTYKGLARDLNLMQKHLREKRPPIIDLPIEQIPFEILFQITLCGGALEDARRFFTQIVIELESVVADYLNRATATVADTLMATSRVYMLFQSVNPNDHQPPETNNPPEETSDDSQENAIETASDAEKRDENANNLNDAKDLFNAWNSLDEDDEPDNLDGAETWSSNDVPEQPLEAGEIAFSYDEWDRELNDFRLGWCRVIEKRVKRGERSFIELTRERYKGVISSIRHQFQLMKPENLTRINRELDGEDYDLNAVIDYVADKRAAGQQSDRIYTKRLRRERDVAVSFLLDQSSSTARTITRNPLQPYTNPGKRIIEIEKEGLVLMSEALEAVGDSYAIHGFTSEGRRNVKFYTVKDFNEKYTDEVERKIGGISFLNNTRLGAAIRHSADKLLRQEARTKLMIILTDGRPYDHDYGDARYAREDVREALRDAKFHGITPFCITIDRDSESELKDLYGDVGYTIIDDVLSLPERLPNIYRRLTS